MLRSAMTPATQVSASLMAASSLMFLPRFCRYLARTRLSATNWSIYSMGLDAVADACCAQVRTIGSLPRRLVRKLLLSTMPSSTL